MKKVISLFLSFVMLLSLTAGLDFSAYADTLTTGKCGENVTYSFDSDTGTLTISGTGDMYDYYSSKESVFYNNGKIKAVIIEKGVTSIGDSAFRECTSLTSITISDSVTSIGWLAFYNCTSLTSVTIPDSVTSIGYSAFWNCTSLTSVTIPDSVTSIDDYAFVNCESLISINVEENNSNYSSVNGVLFNRNQNELICYPAGKNDKTYEIPDSVTSIGGFAFCSCTSLESVTIPDSVTSIGMDAFNNCTSLTSVTISDSVTSIGRSAFYNCTSLTSVTIPKGVTSIGMYAFYNCTSLESVTIPNSVTSIGGSAFENCTSLTSVTIPDSVTSIGDYAFYYCTSLTSVTIPKGVTSIGDYAFYYCTSLTSVTIPDSVTSIERYSFYNCTSLESVTIPDGVTSIGDHAFWSCTSLKSVTISNSVMSIGYKVFDGCTSLTNVTKPDSVTEIGESAFENCTSLGSVTIPNSVTSIRDFAFYNCTSLESVTIPDSVTSIGYDAFYNCTSLTSVTIPDSVTFVGDCAFEKCTSLTSINVEENNINYSSVNGVLFNQNQNELICYPAGKNDKTYEIPDSVTRIGQNAFENCTSLESVTIPNSVTSIGDCAFYDCESLTSVTIPDSVTSIGGSAFYNCISLAVAVILGDNVSIDSNAFENDTLLLCKSSTKLKDREGFESQEIKYFDDVSDDASIVNDFLQFNYKTKELYGGEDWNEDNVIYCFTANESRTYYSNSNIVFDEDFNLVKSKKIDRINDSTSRNQSESEGYSFELVKGKKYYFINGIIIKDFIYCGDEKQYVGFDYNNYCKLKVIYPDDKSVDFNYSIYKENLEQTQKAQFCGKVISFDLNNPVSFDSFEVLNSECIDSVFLTALKNYDQKTLDKYPIIYRLHLTDGTVYDVKNYTMQCVAGETTSDGNSYSDWYCITSDGKKISIEFEYDNNSPNNLVIYIDDRGKDPYYKLNPSTVVNVNEHVHNWINGTIIKQATCTDNGEKCYTCSICNETKTELIKKTGHTYKQTVTPATTSKDGKIVKKCSVCGAVSTVTIAKASSVSLSSTRYTYNGSVKTPSVTVKNSKGKALTKGKDYTVTYSSGRKNVGKYSVKITFKGNYSGTVTKTFTVKPKATSVNKLTALKGGIKVYVNKQATQTTGYQIQYSTSSSFANAKTATIGKNTTLSKSITGLAKGKRYYVRVRTYKTVNGTKYYSSWSKAKSITTKK